MQQNMSDNIITAIGGFKRVMVVRLKPGTDVLLGLEEACRQHGITNGVIVSGIGAVTRAAFANPTLYPGRKQPYNYGETIVLEGGIGISGASGVICHEENGDLSLHVHMSFSDEKGDSYAGHLREGTRTMVTVDVVIAELDGVSMTRKFDSELEVMLMSPEEVS